MGKSKKYKRVAKPWLIKGWLVDKVRRMNVLHNRNAWQVKDEELAALVGITDGIISPSAAKKAIDAAWLSANVSHKKPISYDRFYHCREWRELRYRALATYGNKCQCCGAGPEDGAKIHVDHIKPRSTHRHLQLEFSNLQILCDACNLGKSNLDSTDWRERMDAENIAHLRVIK